MPAVAVKDYRELLGDPAPLSAASYEIRIGPKTKYVNVTGGETVKFVVGDKAFTWYFDVSRNTDRFDLNEVAPPGVLDHPVIVYIAPDPQWIGK